MAKNGALGRNRLQIGKKKAALGQRCLAVLFFQTP
jgi:hypothetical protein